MKGNASKLLFFLVIMVVIGSSACTAIIGTPEPPTPIPTAIPTQIQPTPTQTQPPPAPEFFTEEFENNLDNWNQAVVLNGVGGNLKDADIYVKDGYLNFEMGKWLIGYEFYKPYEYSNVRIDVSVENRGTNVNNVMLVCRSSGEGHYLVTIANSGLYALYAFDGAKSDYIRLADGGSTKIRPGKEVNEYSLVCNNRSLIIYINGDETRNYTDTQYVFQKGLIGVGVASEDQLPFELGFDWVKISQP